MSKGAACPEGETMRTVFVTVAVIMCLALSYDLIGARAQPSNEPNLVITGKDEPKPDSAGLDCVQTAYTRAKINQMASCPADTPLLNGIMFSIDTDLSQTGTEAHWSFHCCKISIAKPK